MSLERLTERINRIELELKSIKFPEVPLGLSLIAETFLSGTAASVTFSDIPQTARHLQLICQARTDNAAESDGLLLRFNGDTAANYDIQFISVNDTTVSGNGLRAQTSIQIASVEATNSRAANFSPVVVEIPGYARASVERWAISRSALFGNVSADTDQFLQLFAGRWRSTAAITSLTLLPLTGANFAAGSLFQLYGVY